MQKKNTMDKATDNKFFDQDPPTGTIVKRLTDSQSLMSGGGVDNVKYEGFASDQQSSQNVNYIGGDAGDDTMNMRNNSQSNKLFNYDFNNQI